MSFRAKTGGGWRIVFAVTAAREAVPGLRELIAGLNAEVAANNFPKGELHNRRINAVEDAIKAIETATTQPELRSIPATPKAK